MSILQIITIHPLYISLFKGWNIVRFEHGGETAKNISSLFSSRIVLVVALIRNTENYWCRVESEFPFASAENCSHINIVNR